MADLFTLVFALGGWRSGLSRIGDNSFFWHLQTGRWILDHGIPYEDPYSFTAPGVRWVAQSWLAELLYGALDRTAGLYGVRVLVAMTGALLAAFTFRLVLRLCGDHLVAVGLTLAAVGASFTLWSARPLFLGLLFFVGVLWIVEVPDSPLGRRAYVSLPALMWVWANVHGTYALGFAYLGLHVIGRWLDGAPPWRGRERMIVQTAALALAVVLLNPYGPGIVVFPFKLLGRGEILRQVTEWRSPDIHTVQGIMLAVWAVVFIACLVLGRRRLSRRDLVVTVPFLLLAVWAQRNIAVAPLVGVAAAARAVAPPAPRPPGGTPLNRIVAVAMVALAAVWGLQAGREAPLDLEGYPVAGMRFIAEQGLLGSRLMTTDQWAGYVILVDWPQQRVFFDDRFDMYPLDVLHDAFRFADAEPSWAEILDRWKIDVVLWPRHAPIAGRLAADARWERRYEDGTAVVYTRRPPPPTPALPAGATTEAAPTAAIPLQAAVDRFVAGQSVPFSIVVEDRSTGVRASHLADRQVLSASLYKLFVAAELLQRIGDGTLDRNAPAEDGRDVGQCIRDMIVVSDNKCGAWGLRTVGSGARDPQLVREGFSGTSLASPQRTTAEDVARFLLRTRDGTLLGPQREALTGELYRLLQSQEVNDRLTVGLAPGTPLAHKTGDRLHWAHDAGVVALRGRELLIVVLSGPWPAPCCDAERPGAAEAIAFGAIAELARDVAAAAH